MERELEVKVLGMDFDDLKERVISLGGILISEEEQINTLIDSSDKPIKTYLDAYLRIRETRDLISNKEKTVITLKKSIDNHGLRDNHELTTDVGDKETMLRILKDLGFDKIQVGYKERTSYELMGARLDFDKWDPHTYPYPYLEIEVKDFKHLNEVTSALGIPQENISTKSIVQLREELKLV